MTTKIEPLCIESWTGQTSHKKRRKRPLPAGFIFIGYWHWKMWNCHLQLISHLKKDGPNADLWHWVGEKIGPTWHQHFFSLSRFYSEDSNSRLLEAMPLLSSEFRIVISICFRTTVWLSLVYKSSLMNLSLFFGKKKCIYKLILFILIVMQSQNRDPNLF